MVVVGGVGGEGKSAKSVTKILDTNWIRIALHYVNVNNINNQATNNNRQLSAGLTLAYEQAHSFE